MIKIYGGAENLQATLTGLSTSVDWFIDYTDIAQNTVVDSGVGQGNVAPAVVFTLVPGPSSPKYTRQVNYISFVNNDAVNSVTILVKKLNIGGSAAIEVATLQGGWQLKYQTSVGWQVFDINGINVPYPLITLSGDVTGSGTTSIPVTLNTVNPDPGSYGTAMAIPQFTVNGKGLITAITQIPVDIQAPGGFSGSIQYNVGGVFSGDNNFVWNWISRVLTINGTLVVTTIQPTEILDSTNSPGTAGQVLSWNGTALVWETLPPSSPGGSNKQLQYNDSGVFGGTDFFYYNNVAVAPATVSTYGTFETTFGSSTNIQPGLRLDPNVIVAGILGNQDATPSAGPYNMSGNIALTGSTFRQSGNVVAGGSLFAFGGANDYFTTLTTGGIVFWTGGDSVGSTSNVGSRIGGSPGIGLSVDGSGHSGEYRIHAGNQLTNAIVTSTLTSGGTGYPDGYWEDTAQEGLYYLSGGTSGDVYLFSFTVVGGVITEYQIGAGLGYGFGEGSTVSDVLTLSFVGDPRWGGSVIGSGLQITVDAVASNTGGSIKFYDAFGNNPLIIESTGDFSLSGSVGTSGQVLTSQGPGTAPIWTSTSASGPGGSNTDVQFNNGGSFGGDGDFQYTGPGQILLGGAGDVGSTTIQSGVQTSGAGVQLNLVSGTATTSGQPGGNVNITLGAGDGSGPNGAFGVIAFGANYFTVQPVSLTQSEIQFNLAQPGTVVFDSGNTGGAGNQVIFRSGFASGGSNANGGGLTLTTGSGDGTGVAGAFYFGVNNGSIVYGVASTGDFQDTTGSSGTSGYVFTSQGTGSPAHWAPAAGGSVPLTATQIAFGSGSNILTSSNKFTWDDTGLTLTLGTATGPTTITTPASGSTDAPVLTFTGLNIDMDAGHQTGTTGTGGHIEMNGGQSGSTSGNGGFIQFAGGQGAGVGNNGGGVAFASGIGISGAGNGQIEFDVGSTNVLNLEPTATDANFKVNVKLNNVGNGIYIKEGTNATSGLATLVGGTITVSNTLVTANSRIHLTTQNPGGTVGFVYISSRSVGTSFTITSLSPLDTSDVAWLIIEPL